MIFWKEWRELRGRFFTLAAFYLITLLFLPINLLVVTRYIQYFVPNLLTTGALLILIPMVLGMDAYVTERDGETEDFLCSKPISRISLFLSKIGLRAALTLLLAIPLLAIIVIKLGIEADSLYLATPPFLILFVLLSIVSGLLIILFITGAVSARVPYQSTALIIGGSAGATLAAFPIILNAWELQYLQAPWQNFWLLILVLMLSILLALFLFTRIETGRSEP